MRLKKLERKVERLENKADRLEMRVIRINLYQQIGYFVLEKLTALDKTNEDNKDLKCKVYADVVDSISKKIAELK